MKANVPSEPIPLAAVNAMSGGVIATLSGPNHKMVKCINCDVTFVNIGARVEQHKECLIGSGVACYVPITIFCPDPAEFVCMLCNVGVNLADVGAYKLDTSLDLRPFAAVSAR